MGGFTNVGGRKKRPPMAAGFAVPTPTVGEAAPGMGGAVNPAGPGMAGPPAIPAVTPSHTKSTTAEQLVRAARDRLFGPGFDIRNATPAQIAQIHAKNLFANNPAFSHPQPGAPTPVPRGTQAGPVGTGGNPPSPVTGHGIGAPGMKQPVISTPFDLPTPGVVQPKGLQRRRRSAGY